MSVFELTNNGAGQVVGQLEIWAMSPTMQKLAISLGYKVSQILGGNITRAVSHAAREFTDGQWNHGDVVALADLFHESGEAIGNGLGHLKKTLVGYAGNAINFVRAQIASGDVTCEVVNAGVNILSTETIDDADKHALNQVINGLGDVVQVNNAVGINSDANGLMPGTAYNPQQFCDVVEQVTQQNIPDEKTSSPIPAIIGTVSCLGVLGVGAGIYRWARNLQDQDLRRQREVLQSVSDEAYYAARDQFNVEIYNKGVEINGLKGQLRSMGANPNKSSFKDSAEIRSLREQLENVTSARDQIQADASRALNAAQRQIEETQRSADISVQSARMSRDVAENRWKDGLVANDDLTRENQGLKDFQEHAIGRAIGLDDELTEKKESLPKRRR